MSEEQKVHKEQTTRSIGYIESIDGIRGFYVFPIIIMHLHLQHIKMPAFIPHFTLHLFFILSAYLISSILYKQKEKSESFKLFAKDFYIKRALRILPLYWAYILFFFGVAVVLRTVAPALEQNFLGVIHDLKHYGWMLLTFTFNYRELFSWSQDLSHLRCHVFPHLWSISIEEQFYLIIPTLIFFLNKKSIKIISIIVVCVYPLIRTFGYIYFRDVVEMRTTYGDEWNALFNFFYRSSFFQFDAFFYGLLIPLIRIEKRYILYAGYFISLLLMILSQSYNAVLIADEQKISFWSAIHLPTVIYSNNQFMYMNTLYNIFGFFLIYIMINDPKSLLNKFYNAKVFRPIGKVLYGMYVYHPVFALLTLALYYGFLVKVIPNILADIIAIAICTTATYYFAKLSYYKFEIYFLNLKSKK